MSCVFRTRHSINIVSLHPGLIRWPVNYQEVTANNTAILLDFKTILFLNYVPSLDMNVAVEDGKGTYVNS